MNKEKPKYTIYTDGGCAVNPGGPGGYGVVFMNNDTGEYIECFAGFFSTTNNRMEVMAIITALGLVPAGESVEIYSDSQYAINCATGVWQQNKNQDLWAKYRKAAKGRNITFHWVKGHNGNQYNTRCDELATEAMYSEGRMADTGYKEAKQVGREFFERVEKIEKASPKKNQTIDLPEPYNTQEIDYMSVRSYAEKYRVHTTCASAIMNFSQSDHSFGAYMKLRTGGIDEWSRKSDAAIIESLSDGETVYKILQDHLHNAKDILTALRWYKRGLPLRYCIRKIQVDEEVRRNAIG